MCIVLLCDVGDDMGAGYYVQVYSMYDGTEGRTGTTKISESRKKGNKKQVSLQTDRTHQILVFFAIYYGEEDVL